MKYIINTDALYGGDIYKSMLLMGTNGRGEVIVQKFNLDELEELNGDYINEHYGSLQDEAYQRGLEDGKAVNDKGCEGCKYGGSPQGSSPCYNCSNYYKNNWMAKDDKFEAGDEVKAEDGTVVFFVTWMSDRCICGIDKEGKCYSYEPKEICGKTGRHFDIILEEKKA